MAKVSLSGAGIAVLVTAVVCLGTFAIIYWAIPR